MSKPAKFRKLPVVIEAVQYVEYGRLVTGMCNSQSCLVAGNPDPHVHTIHEGQISILAVGDWIIPEPDGEHFYPCQPDIFALTYESAATPTDAGLREALVKALELMTFYASDGKEWCDVCDAHGPLPAHDPDCLFAVLSQGGGA